MIKTDKVIYRTRTQEEYDWLMEKLEEAGCEWLEGWTPVGGKKVCGPSTPDSYIWVEGYIISFSDEDFFYAYYNNNLGTNRYEIFEVSDLMEDEKETDAQDKTEEEDKQRKIKKIVYTTEVCFE